MRIIAPCVVLVMALAAPCGSASAQHETDQGIAVDRDLALLRRDLRSEKKKIIAANLPLTEAEATKFWPVYDSYAAEMSKSYDEFYAVVRDYAEHQKTLTDAQAMSMLKRWSAAQVDVAQTRQKYVPMFEKVLPGKKAAYFFQVDRRLYAALDLRVTQEVPLVIQ